MDVTTIVVSTALTVAVMLAIYHLWIIPKVVDGIKTELPDAILGIVDSKFDTVLAVITETLAGKIGEVKENIAETIESKTMSITKSIAGKKGATSYAASLAEKFLLKNGVTDENLETVMTKYGQEALEMLVKKTSKPADADNVPGDQWKCQ